MGDISKHFSSTEAACPCCGDLVINDDLVDLLEEIRGVFGPVKINSWFRCPIHNAAVGGSLKSQHLLGKAADIVTSTDPREVYKWLHENYKGHGFGDYRTFTHVDVRDYTARWKG